MFRILNFGFWILDRCGFPRSSSASTPVQGRKERKPSLFGRETGEGEPEGSANAILREGLAALATPPTAPDFAARIQAELVTGRGRSAGQGWRPTLGEVIRAELRPVLAAAACSLCLTLALVQWSAQIPASNAVPPTSALPVQTLTADALLDRLEQQQARRTHLGMNLLRQMNLPQRTLKSTEDTSRLVVPSPNAAI